MKPVSGCVSLEEQNLGTLGPNGIALLVASYLLLFVTESVDFITFAGPNSPNQRFGQRITARLNSVAQ